jgi:hypothetical protein
MLRMRFAPQTIPAFGAPRFVQAGAGRPWKHRLSDNLLTGFSFFATLAL